MTHYVCEGCYRLVGKEMEILTMAVPDYITCETCNKPAEHAVPGYVFDQIQTAAKEIRVIVDIDDVCADLLSVWLARYNADYGDFLTRHSITEWDMTKFVKSSCGAKIYDYLNSPDIYDKVQPIQGALDGVYYLRQMNLRVLFVTAADDGQKLRWLRRHGFLSEDWKSARDFIACRDKYLINADMIIDDRPETIASFPGIGILFDRPHNQHAKQLTRACGWKEVVRIVYDARYGEGSWDWISQYIW